MELFIAKTTHECKSDTKFNPVVYLRERGNQKKIENRSIKNEKLGEEQLDCSVKKAVNQAKKGNTNSLD